MRTALSSFLLSALFLAALAHPPAAAQDRAAPVKATVTAPRGWD